MLKAIFTHMAAALISSTVLYQGYVHKNLATHVSTFLIRSSRMVVTINMTIETFQWSSYQCCSHTFHMTCLKPLIIDKDTDDAVF